MQHTWHGFYQLHRQSANEVQRGPSLRNFLTRVPWGCKKLKGILREAWGFSPKGKGLSPMERGRDAVAYISAVTLFMRSSRAAEQR